VRVRHVISHVRAALQSCPKKNARKQVAFADGSGEPSAQNITECRLWASSGFTLLEVLVALTVFALGAAVMLSLISGSLGNIRKVQLRTRTIEHAEAVMELTLLDESIQGPTSFTGDFPDGTRWSVLVEEYVPPDISNMQLDGRQVVMPVKLLSYSVEMFSPDSGASEYQLQTLKMVRKTPDDSLTRLP
jgi:prepilin-type N-terminal cleavage/methylation domain-containing protein